MKKSTLITFLLAGLLLNPKLGALETDIKLSAGIELPMGKSLFAIPTEEERNSPNRTDIVLRAGGLFSGTTDTKNDKTFEFDAAKFFADATMKANLWGDGKFNFGPSINFSAEMLDGKITGLGSEDGFFMQYNINDNASIGGGVYYSHDWMFTKDNPMISSPGFKADVGFKYKLGRVILFPKIYFKYSNANETKRIGADLAAAIAL